MDVENVRRLLARGRVTWRFADHAIIEGRKDGLTAEALEDSAVNGEVIEDYGVRVLLLHFTRDDRIPYHIVLEYLPRTEEVTVVTAYVPDPKEWEPHWKKRRRRKRR